MQLIQLLSQFPDFILCGDFNASRDRVVFDKIASFYKDNIPAQATTSIDKMLHRAGDLQLFVDGLFLTSHYRIEDVKLHAAPSDYMGIITKVFLQ
ncbi:hypothetical protein Bealeia1_00050 [Candidatus Bealeia paramacronuclearis]|uniref:Endonuclease/exonuclease/phosphatase domain-containing protein n=1 Tax=Candidatus Bealeia paramacronuclearis TaxID=1921001 RepID=A0ABZ2C025_9PROT|nr:hypothetical protein [Candidatus Bealeia paramacronuclearis]